MSYQLGIDLGTTYTAAAVARSSGPRQATPEVVTLGSRSAAVASVLYLAEDGSMLVGEAADRRAVTEPDRVVREFKRRIGDPTPLHVAGRSWSPQDLSARLARWVVDRVAEREGGPAERIAVTHPASWGPHKKELLAEALAGQGLEVSFLSEPEAAALHYAANERVEPGSTIAVYDLGGGTFDAAVVRKEADGFRLLGEPEGVDRLGGVDFDELVFEHVRAGMPDAFEGLDDTDPAVLAAVAQVRRECTEAKEALSSDTEVTIPVLLPGAQGSVRLHRSEFEEMIRPQLEETVSALRRAISSAGLAPEELTAILLVGGSSRIPLVAQLVSELLERPVAVDADPKHAIVKGAVLSVASAPAAQPVAAPIPAPSGGGEQQPAATATAEQPILTPLQGIPVVTAASGTPTAPVPPTPSPVSPTPPTGVEAATQLMPHATGPLPPRPPVGPATGPLAMAGGQQQHSASPMVVPEPSSGREQQRRWPLGLLAGVGGFVVISLIVVASFFWPDDQRQTQVGTTGSEGTAATATLPPAVAPANGPEDTTGTTDSSGGDRGDSRPATSRGGGNARPPVQAPNHKAPNDTTTAPPPSTGWPQSPPSHGNDGGSTGNTGGDTGGNHGDGTGSNGNDNGGGSGGGGTSGGTNTGGGGGTGGGMNSGGTGGGTHSGGGMPSDPGSAHGM